MNIALKVKGQAVCLNATELNDLLKGLEYALAGGLEVKSFGCVTACAGRPAADGVVTFAEGVTAPTAGNLAAF